MSVVTIRANHTSFPFTQTGGARDPQWEQQDRVAFMDAIEDRRTVVLDKLVKKGAASNELKPRWGNHGVTPRGSVVGATFANNTNTLTLPTGHGARFQQGHVLQLVRKSDNEVEHLWVNDDPASDGLPVIRARGGTSAIQFEVGDTVSIIGIAMPEGSDFPQAPVSTGRAFYNRWQFFAKSLQLTDQADVIPDVEFGSGERADAFKLQQAKDAKMDLDRAILLSKRQAGDPSPAAPRPSTMGGIIQMGELSGNIYSGGGSNVLLGSQLLKYVQNDMDDKYGDKAATHYIMSYNTLSIMESLLVPMRWNAGVDGTTYDDRFTSYRTSVGTITLQYTRDFPDGLILGYNPNSITYHPLEGHDWKEKDFPTKGFHQWHGLGGIYTTKATGLLGMFIIRGFDTNLNHYPVWDRPSTWNGSVA